MTDRLPIQFETLFTHLNADQLSEEKNITSKNGDWDYWSFAAVGVWTGNRLPFVAWSMTKRCTLYCPDDNNSTTEIRVNLGLRLPIEKIFIKSGECTAYPEAETPRRTIPPFSSHRVPNAQCKGVSLRFTNALNFNLTGLWFSHYGEISLEHLYLESGLLSGKTSDAISITSAFHSPDWWSFAAVGAAKSHLPLVSYVIDKECALFCPDDDNQEIEVKIECSGLDPNYCEPIIFKILKKSGNCSTTAKIAWHYPGPPKHELGFMTSQ
jgi:Pyruvate/2-oxoacid:ferredoxin oxidoreductase delta subunit